MRKKQKKSEGFILVFFGISLVLLLGIGGFSVDVGSLYFHKQLIQRAADTAALSAVLKIHSSDNAVRTEALDILSLNDVDILNTSIKDQIAISCGVYNGTTKIFSKCGTSCSQGPCPCTDCQTAATNAVQVEITRNVPSFLTKVLNINSFTPRVIAVAAARTDNSHQCLRPFGIEELSIDGISPGSNFNVGKNSPGNWGRLDLGQGGGSQNYETAMMNGHCSASVALGASIPPYTGNSNSIDNSFNALVAANQHKNLIFGLTTPFGNGNKNVNLVGFAIMDFVSQTGSGNNWRGTFKLVSKHFIIPPYGGGIGAPKGRYLAPI